MDHSTIADIQSIVAHAFGLDVAITVTAAIFIAANRMNSADVAEYGNRVQSMLHEWVPEA